MIVGMLAGVCLLGPTDWASTAQWLDAMACPTLAVEAMLVSPPHDADDRAIVAEGLMGAIASASPGDAAAVRARIELLQLLSGLDSMDAHRAKLVLLADDRAAAVQAQGSRRRDLLRGALQAAQVMRHDLDADLKLATDISSRRTLEAFGRRVGLLNGLIQVDLQERPADAASALRAALLDGIDPGPQGVQGIPNVMLESVDGAWAALALAQLDLQQGNVNGAQAWVDRLIEVRSSVLRQAGSQLVQDVLLAMPADIRGDVLAQWDQGLHVDTLLSILSNAPALDGHVLRALESRSVRSRVIETLAAANRPLPTGSQRVAAHAAFRRAERGALTFDAAKGFIDAALAIHGEDAQLQVALARVLAASGKHSESVDVALSVPAGEHKAQADAVAMFAILQVAPQDAANPNDAVLIVLLERMAARRPQAPLRHEAALRLATLPSTEDDVAMALLGSIPQDHVLQPLVIRQREVVAWRSWRRTGGGAATSLMASRAVLDLEGPDAAAAAQRLLAVVRHTNLDAMRMQVVATRAVEAIANEHGPAAGRGAAAAFELASGEIELALQTLQGAWAQELRDPRLIEVARDVLATRTPLGPAADALASRVLGRSPMAFRVDEVTADARVVLRHWARHLAGSGVMTSAAMEHAAALDVLDQDGLMLLGQAASELGRWPVAVRAWGRAADLGGVSGGNCKLEQARSLAHINVASARDLARQLAVLHAGTALGDAAQGVADSLDRQSSGGTP